MQVNINQATYVYNIEKFVGDVADLHGQVDALPAVAPEVRERVNSELDKAVEEARKSPKDTAAAKTHLERAADILKSTNGIATGAVALVGTIGAVAAKLGLGL